MSTAFEHVSTLSLVGSQDRAERPELHPPGVQFGEALAVHVAADIVTPEPEADVRCGGGEVRLEVEGFPADQGITGETDLA